MTKAQQKAIQLVRDGKVHITWSDETLLAAKVDGATSTYLVQIAYIPEPTPSCECLWWSMRHTKCSHLLALELELARRREGLVI